MRHHGKGILLSITILIAFLMTVQANADSVGYTYDASGQLVTVTNGTSSDGYSYDEVGNLTDAGCDYTVWYLDGDDDGYPSSTTATQCTRPSADYKLSTELTSMMTDCDDDDDQAIEAQVLYVDKDGDGYSTGQSVLHCGPLSGYALESSLTSIWGDCSDDPAVDQYASYLHEDITWYLDVDNDGFPSPEGIITECVWETGSYKQWDDLTYPNFFDYDDNDSSVFASPIVSGGYAFSIALKTDSTVLAWGDNTYGQLGIGNTVGSSNGVLVITDDEDPESYLTDVVAVSAGLYFALALKKDGTVWAWGDNANGQLGIGSIDSNTHPVAVQVQADASNYLTNVVQIVSGANFAMALKADGTVWAWGDNANGQLGKGTTGDDQSYPVQVQLASGGYLTNIVGISGWAHGLALRSGGTVWAWGRNTYGAIGDGTEGNNRTKAVQVLASAGHGLQDITAISAGGHYSMALKSDGTVRTWGNNVHGQLGDGTLNIDRLYPVQVQLDAGGSLQDAVDVAAGMHFSVIRKSDGTVWTSGYNDHGQLGSGMNMSGSSYKTKAVEVITDTGNPSSFLTNTVSASENRFAHGLVVKDDGTVWGWGYNTSSQLADGTTADRNYAVQAMLEKCYEDQDGDGYSTGTMTYNTSLLTGCPSGYYLAEQMTALSGDCDDSDPDINPATVWYYDGDGDGYGTDTNPLTQCQDPDPTGNEYVLQGGDCDDTDPDINPDTVWYQDADEDGYTTGSTLTTCDPGSGYSLESDLVSILPIYYDPNDSDPDVTPTLYSDLIVTSVSGPGIANTGSVITGTVKYKNVGLANVPVSTSFRVALYLSTDTDITTGDTYVGMTNTTGITIGQEKTWNYSLTVPSGMSSGTYYIGAIVDPTSVIYESDETNNDLSGNTIAIDIPVIGVSPSPYNYGSVDGGETGTHTFTVSNDGWQSLILGNLIINGVDAGDYALDAAEDTCSGQTLSHSNTCTFDAEFSPSATGLRYGTVEIPSNDPVTPLYSLALTGTGATTPNIKAQAILLDEDFESGIPWNWAISNGSGWSASSSCNGSGSCAIVNATSQSVNDLYTPVFDASSCSVDLEFDSNFIKYGSTTASVLTTDDGGQNWTTADEMTSSEGPELKVLNGIIGNVATAAAFSLDSETSGFWEVDNVQALCSPARLKFLGLVNTATAAQTVEVTNRGFADLTIGTVIINGTDSSYFDIDYDGCSSAELSSGESCQIDVVFTAADFTSRSATLAIPSDDPDTSTLNVPLSGEVVNELNEAEYLEGLHSVTDGDSSATNTTDLLSYLTNGTLSEGTNYPIKKSQGKYKVLSVQADLDSQYMNELHLYMYSYADSGDVFVYVYQDDGVSIDTSDSLSFSITSGWNDLDLTSLMSLMDGYGFVKFRLVPDGTANVGLQEGKLAPEY